MSDGARTSLMALALAGLCACRSGAAPVVETDAAPAVSVAPQPLAPRGFLAPTSFADIAKAANPSVVTVQLRAAEPEEPSDPFDGRAPSRPIDGLGSGFFIDTEGTVLTNYHVITGDGARKKADASAALLQITLFDDREMSAEIVGVDPPTDLAVLKVPLAAPSRPLVLGDSETLEVGDWVLAIGNPFGLSHTVSAGIVSGKGRTSDEVPLDPAGYYDFLQTDASINPGNSGGPLLDLRGQVIGINTAIRGGGAQGIGFAVPTSIVRELLPILQKHGKVTRSALGLRARDLREIGAPQREALGFPAHQRCARIEHVEPGGAAAEAKLQVGDCVVEFEGEPIERASRLSWLASMAGVGKMVRLTVLRPASGAEQPPPPQRVAVQAALRALAD